MGGREGRGEGGGGREGGSARGLLCKERTYFEAFGYLEGCFIKKKTLVSRSWYSRFGPGGRFLSRAVPQFLS